MKRRSTEKLFWDPADSQAISLFFKLILMFGKQVDRFLRNINPTLLERFETLLRPKSLALQGSRCLKVAVTSLEVLDLSETLVAFCDHGCLKADSFMRDLVTSRVPKPVDFLQMP